MSLKSQSFSTLLVPGNESWISDSFFHTALVVKMNTIYSHRAKSLIKILT